MANSNAKIEQALTDLIEAFAELEEEVEVRHVDDDAAYEHAIVETLETSLEIAVEESGQPTGAFANLLSCLSEALEELDPSAFEDEEEEDAEEDDDAEIDIDEEDEDYEEDEDEDDDHEDEDEDDLP